MSDLIAFLNARLDEAEAAARNHTCIHCGHRTAPLRSALGITGYTHDRWNPRTGVPDGWEGQRCRGRITGAEPVQDPARVLREVATWRKLLLEYSIPPGTDAKYGGTERETGFRLALSFALKCKAAEYHDHPDYRAEWGAPRRDED